MLSRDLGLPESSSSFEPSWFVWLPERTLVVDKVEAVVGAPPPSAGATLISGATPLIAVELMDEFGDSVLLPEGTNWIATIGLNTVNVDTESGSVDDVADLRQLQVDTPTDTRTLVAQLLRQDSQLAITVPSSAVSVNESGRVCVWIESIAGEFTSVDVEVSRSVGGSARLSAGVEPGERVLSNPDQVAEAGPCP